MNKKITSFAVILMLIFSQIPVANSESTCNEVQFIFARGSGSSLNADDYKAFHNALISQLAASTLNYSFYELGTSSHGGHTYPAISVGVNNLNTFRQTLGAVVGSGDAFAYGNSVSEGAEELKAYISEVNTSCPSTKFVIAGYSQGAQVISKSLSSLDASKIIYAATFGDPKIYLPEGAGDNPVACSGENLSPYRVDVQDCYAYKGILGGNVPYQPSNFSDGQVGTWCLYLDIMCSAHVDIVRLFDAHLNYRVEGKYADAANTITKKLAELYPAKVNDLGYSNYDVLFLFDTTDSMTPHIDEYKAEAINLTNQVLEAGGRVAFYDFGDLSERREHRFCSFETCDSATVTSTIESLTSGGGGDYRESLLSAAKNAMSTEVWQDGAKKAMIVLTDSTYLDPDRDGTTLADVVNLSQSIDPVNIYVINGEGLRRNYQELVSLTNGAFFSYDEEVELSTRVISHNLVTPPSYNTIKNVWNLELEPLSTNAVRITYQTDASRVFIALDDAILGQRMERNADFVLTDLTYDVEHTISLIPYSGSGARGPVVSGTIKFVNPETDEEISQPIIEIKVPNTGQFSN